MVLSELKDKLKTLDEITLLEVLNVNSELLVERFDDLIEEDFEQLARQFQEEAGDTDEQETTD